MKRQQSVFFDHIVVKAHERPLTTDDFKPFIGCHNWMVVDGDDFPLGSRFRDGGAVCKFKLVRPLNNNMVAILVHIDDLVPGGTLQHIDADELAIRMDAS